MRIIILFALCRYAHSCAFISVIELPRIPAYCPKDAPFQEDKQSKLATWEGAHFFIKKCKSNARETWYVILIRFADIYLTESLCISRSVYFEQQKKRVMGIEPTYPAWKAGVLPLNYTRISQCTAYNSIAFTEMQENFFVFLNFFCNPSFVTLDILDSRM